jgi:hypothetical protein
MRLSISLPAFEEKCDALVTEGNNIFIIEITETNEALSGFLMEVDNWNEKAKLFLKQSFDPADNNFSRDYVNAYQSATIDKTKLSLSEIKKELESRIQNIQSVKELVKVSDLIINPENPEVLKRKDFAIAQKEDLLLRKLYILYPKGKYYSVRNLFEYNGVQLNGIDDDVNICTPLKQLDDIDFITTPTGAAAKLTETGVKFVEKFILFINQEPLAPVQSTVNTEDKFISILKELNNSGLVKEIVFDEINDLRQLVNKLTPKQWKEVVLGKLVDLGVQQSVKNDILKSIYEKLTNEKVMFN